ncbi:DUF3575 domain-containing protein [Alistipes timonensis]
MRKIILIVIGFFSFGVGAAQQTSTDTVCVRLYFRRGYSTLDAAFRGNGQRLEAFVERVEGLREDSTQHLRRICIEAGASPEGGTAANRRLATHRAERIRSCLAARLALCEGLFEVRSRGIDWKGLTELVAASAMPYREEVLSILRGTPEWVVERGRVVDGRKRRLGMLHGGRAWRYMEERLFPELRSSGVEIVCEFEEVQAAETALTASEKIAERTDIPATATLSDTAAEPPATPAISETSVLPETTAIESASSEKVHRPFRPAVATNLLYDACLIPNLGIELPFAAHWSVGANWMHGWKERHAARRRLYAYGGELHLRRWFGRRAQERPLAGHHFGAYGQLLRYNIRTSNRGYLSDRWSCGAGVEYGYGLPLGGCLRLDMSIGVGYLTGICREYERQDGCDVWQATGRRHWFGPTKAEIALVWVFGSYDRKGGRR